MSRELFLLAGLRFSLHVKPSDADSMSVIRVPRYARSYDQTSTYSTIHIFNYPHIQLSTYSTIHEPRRSQVQTPEFLIYAATYLIHMTVYLYKQSTIHVPNRPHIQSRIYPPITHPPIPLTDHTHTHTHTHTFPFFKDSSIIDIPHPSPATQAYLASSSIRQPNTSQPPQSKEAQSEKPPFQRFFTFKRAQPRGKA